MITHEDIESFGFKHKFRSICQFYVFTNTPIEDVVAGYGYWHFVQLRHCADTNVIDILAKEYELDNDETNLFRGILNTKEELAFILKAIGITK